VHWSNASRRWRHASRVGAPGLAWLASLALAAYALHHPSPLVIDLGAGDEAVAAGFSEGWSRYELRAKTTFRWTGEAASLALPLSAVGRDVSVEMRLARFAEHATPVTIESQGRLIASWLQHPVGWRLRRFPAGAWQGPVSLDLRAPASENEPAGLAIDWCALRGVESVWPRGELWLSLLALVGLAPLLVSLVLRRRWPLAYASPAALAVLAAWVTLDTAAATTTAALAGPRVLVACAVALPLVWWIGRRSGETETAEGRSLVCIPALLMFVALCALANPRYHYPDVDTHARFLAGMRDQPSWALDPREYQQHTHAWTRLIGDRYVGFPYSAAFHALAWPLALGLGEIGALKTLAVMAVAASLALVYRLSRASGASPRIAVLAQALFAIMPVVPSRLTLALLPSLLGQAMELGLLLALATRFGELVRWRECVLALLLLFAVQASYTGSLYNVAFVVLIWAVVDTARGHASAAGRLLAAYGLAALGVACLQYRYFIPLLFSDVLPHLNAPGAATPTLGDAATPLEVLGRAAQRLWIFFGPFGLTLAAIGWTALAKVTQPIRRALFVALGAGLLLALLRPALPVLFADAKEVELLAGPMAIAAALGVARLSPQSRVLRVVAALLVAALAAWSAARAAELYASRLALPLGG
jgi:hypothetical protein